MYIEWLAWIIFLSYEIDPIPTYILFLRVIFFDTIHIYQPYYDYGVRLMCNREVLRIP